MYSKIVELLKTNYALHVSLYIKSLLIRGWCVTNSGVILCDILCLPWSHFLAFLKPASVWLCNDDYIKTFILNMGQCVI